jgi:hypothetical protein
VSDQNELRALVHRALDVAVDENGYRELLTWTDEAVPEDLVGCDADLENYEVEDLLAHVASWRAKRSRP